MPEQTAGGATTESTLQSAVDAVRALVTDTLAGTSQVDPDTARAATDLVSVAVELYGGLARRDGNEMLPMDIPSSTTDAATVAAVLLVTQNLSLFEFNVWYSRVAQAAEEKNAGRAEA